MASGQVIVSVGWLQRGATQEFHASAAAPPGFLVVLGDRQRRCGSGRSSRQSPTSQAVGNACLTTGRGFAGPLKGDGPASALDGKLSDVERRRSSMPRPPPRRGSSSYSVTASAAAAAAAAAASRPPPKQQDTSLSSLPESQIKELKAAFLLLDKNQDGRVNAAEIKHMLDDLGILLTDAMIENLVVQASGRADGLISEAEFLTWMSCQTGIKDDVMEDLLAAFRVFDKDCNGYISKDELKLAMEMIGEPMSEAQLDSMIRASDIDQDGRINYEEFVSVLL
ncbi:calcium-binding protein E63-1 isoform X2 [Ixodes scapularis]